MIEFKANSFSMLDPDTLETVYKADNINTVMETEVEPYYPSQGALTFNNEATFTADIIDTTPLLSYVEDLNNIPLYMEYNMPVMVQARWHKKPRINKKWQKRYGMKKDTLLVRCNITSMHSDYNRENQYETEHYFNIGSVEYKFRPDQLRKNFKLEAY